MRLGEELEIRYADGSAGNGDQVAAWSLETYNTEDEPTAATTNSPPLLTVISCQFWLGAVVRDHVAP